MQQKCQHYLHFFFQTNGASNTSSLFEEIFRIRTDFGGKTVRAVTFNLAPYSTPDFAGSADHGGYEYEIAAAAAAGINLKLEVRHPSIGGWWGDDLVNGNHTGTEHSVLCRHLLYFVCGDRRFHSGWC